MLKNLARVCLVGTLLSNNAYANVVFEEDFSNGFNDWFGMIASLGGEALVAPDSNSIFDIQSEIAVIDIPGDFIFAALGHEIALPSTPGAGLFLSLDFSWQTDAPEEDLIGVGIQDAFGVTTNLLDSIADPNVLAGANSLSALDISAFAGQTVDLLIGIGDFDSQTGAPFDRLTLDNVLITQNVPIPSLWLLILLGSIGLLGKKKPELKQRHNTVTQFQQA